MLRALFFILVGSWFLRGTSASETQSPYESRAGFPSESPLDPFVFPKLQSLNARPALCSDAVFVRRAYLDVIGTMPTAQEAKEFIEDADAKNKRRLLINRLLERDEFADYWSMKWGDMLRIKAEFPVNLWPNAAQAYHRWVRASLAENKPYDRFVREMLTSSGSNFRVGPVNFYRAVQNRTPEGIASAVALAFMGTRMDRWPTNHLAGMAVFFSQIGYKPTREWKEENVFWDPLLSTSSATNGIAPRVTNSFMQYAVVPPTNVVPREAVFPGGGKITLPLGRDPRELFADWLITPENPWFARNIVNRIWAWLLGRGIIHEPDDIRLDNPPSIPELLTYLEKELIASKYDLKHLYRLILNSHAYQVSAMSPCDSPEAEANFASYCVRRLDAEVLIDAVNKVTGATDLYTSAIPEPFTYIPLDKPAIALADGSITSPFLALFGRSARATGMFNERDNKPSPAQWLHMLNSSHIQRKLAQGPKLKAIIDAQRQPEKTAEELYLTIQSRLPTPDEVASVTAYVGNPGSGDRAAVAKQREGWIDVAWALINSTEFLHRH